MDPVDEEATMWREWYCNEYDGYALNWSFRNNGELENDLWCVLVENEFGGDVGATCLFEGDPKMMYSTKDNVSTLLTDGLFYQPLRNEELSWNTDLGNTWRTWQPKLSEGVYDRQPRIHEGYRV